MTISAPARIASLIVLILTLIALLQHRPTLAAGEHGTLVRVATIYLSPDTNSTKMAEIERGRELVVLENAAPPWAHVEALLGPEKTVSGWILDKGFVRSTNPDGDKIVFGEAADSEDEASRRHGRRGADQDALRLYYRVYDLFPNSPLAGEALYRAADIKWQLDRADVMSRPSAKERDPMLREGMDEEWMKEVMKKFPGSKWADLAAFHLIENKLCGDWQGTTKCPEKEAEYYEKYANDRPQSPAAAEALYLAAKRRAATIDMYKTAEERKKAEEAKAKTIALTQKIIQQYPQSDYAARAHRLLFLVQQDVPTYGNAVD
ncbi:MAG TPA: outer membrane protein assembly factor BamD [Terriglobales bacterium]|nr:outer membrane protein assembly factor BamD [Terriglobales bacterium]